MKEVIGKFITAHPIISFLLADVIVKQGCKTIRTVIRGYPEPDTKVVYCDKCDHEDDELLGEEESPVS